MAKVAGFDMEIIDPRTAFATAERFPDVPLHADWPEPVLQARPLDAYTALAAVTHDPKIDDFALKAALDAGCFYVGALGSRKTHARRVERLQAMGVTSEQIARIHAPIGLAIGATSPAGDRSRHTGANHPGAANARAGPRWRRRREVRSGPGRGCRGRIAGPRRPGRRAPVSQGAPGERRRHRRSSRGRHRGGGGSRSRDRRPRRERGSHAHCRGNRRAQCRGEAGRHRPRQFARGGCRRLHCRCREDQCHQRGRSGDYHRNARRQGRRRARTDGRDGQDHPLRGCRRCWSMRRCGILAKGTLFEVHPFAAQPCRHRSHRAARPQGQCDRQDDARHRGAAGAIRQRGCGRTAGGPCGRKPWPTR